MFRSLLSRLYKIWLLNFDVGIRNVLLYYNLIKYDEVSVTIIVTEEVKVDLNI